jgi:hypothetical protein
VVHENARVIFQRQSAVEKRRALGGRAQAISYLVDIRRAILTVLVLVLMGCGTHGREHLAEVIDLGLIPTEATNNAPFSIQPATGSTQLVLRDNWRRQWLVDLNSPQTAPTRMTDREGDLDHLDKRVRAFANTRDGHVLSSASRDDTWAAVVDERRGRYAFAWKQTKDSAARLEDLGPNYDTDPRRELTKSAVQLGGDGSIAAVLVWSKPAVPGGGSPDWYGVELITVQQGAVTRIPLREWDSVEFVSELVLEAGQTGFWAASGGRRLFVWSFDAKGHYTIPQAIVGGRNQHRSKFDSPRLVPTSEGATVAWIDGRHQRMIAFWIDTAKYSVNTQVAVCRVNQHGIGPIGFLSPKDGNVANLAAIPTPQGPCIVWTQQRVNPDQRDQLDPKYPMRLQVWIDRH